MAVAFRAGTNSGTSVSVTFINVAVPAGAAVGDIAVIFLGQWASGATPTVTAPSGFAQQGANFTSGDGAARNSIWWKRLTAADTGNYTFTWTGGAFYTTAQCALFSGCVATGNPWGAVATPVTGTFGSITSMSVNLTSAGGGLFWAVYNDTGGTHTPPTSFTEIADVDCASCGYRIPAASGTQTASGASITSSSSSGAWLGSLLDVAAPTGLTVRAASGFQSGSATTSPIAITLPAGTTTNDLVYVLVSMNSVLATLTQSAGTGTYTNRSPGGTNGDRNSTGGHTSWIFSRTIQAGDTAPSFTIGGTSGKYSWVAITLQPGAGVAAHISLVGPTVESASGTSHTPPTLNAGSTTGMSLLINAWRAAGNAATAVTTTPPTNWIEPTNGDFSTAVGTTAALRQVAAEISARAGQTGTITPGAQVTTSPAAFGNEYHFFAAEQTAFSQSVTDSVGITDPRTQTATYSLGITDSVGILDTAAPVAVTARSQTDPVGILDTPSQNFVLGAVDFAQTVTDPVGITESRTQSAVAAQSVTDAVGLLDSATNSATYSATATDAVGLLDTAAQAVVGARGQTDSVGLLDTTGQVSAASQSLSDALGLLDSVGSAFAVGLTDAVGLSDTAAAVQAWAQSVTDAVGLTDAAAKDLATSLTDNVGLTDAATKALTSSLTDAVGLLDSAAQVSAAAQSLTDLVGLLDSTQVSSTGNITASLTDTLGLTDAASATAASARSQTDAVGLLDSSVKDLTTSLTDAVGLLDTAGQAAVTAQGLSDAVGLSDPMQQSTTGSIVASLTDSVGLSDAAAAGSDLARAASDNLGLTDARTQLYGLTADLTDNLGVADVATQLSTLLVTLTDVLGLSDEVQIQGTSVVAIVLPLTTGAPMDLVARAEAEIPEDLVPRGRAAVPVNRTTRATVKQL